MGFFLQACESEQVIDRAKIVPETCLVVGLVAIELRSKSGVEQAGE